MTDSVISIFKILIKVPFLICVSYLILNLFGFAVCYFKMLGIAYSLQQVVMENNYLPEREEAAIAKYTVNVLESDRNNAARFLHNATIYVGSEDTLNATAKSFEDVCLANNSNKVAGDNKRQQYGQPVTVAVAADFKIMVPLNLKEITGGVKGLDGTYGNSKYVSDRQRNNPVGNAKKGTDFMIRMPMVIKSQIIGMQYYSDLAM